jgi:hypothetical protein
LQSGITASVQAAGVSRNTQLEAIDNNEERAESSSMAEGFAKNVGAAVLVVLVIVVAILVFGGSAGTGTVSTTPADASYFLTPLATP